MGPSVRQTASKATRTPSLGVNHVNGAVFSVLIRIIVFSVYPIEPLLLVYNNGSGTCYLLHLGSENSGSAHSKVNLFLRLVTLM